LLDQKRTEKSTKTTRRCGSEKNVNGRFAGERGTTGLAWFSSSMLLLACGVDIAAG